MMIIVSRRHQFLFSATTKVKLNTVTGQMLRPAADKSLERMTGWLLLLVLDLIKTGHTIIMMMIIIIMIMMMMMMVMIIFCLVD